MKKFAFFIALAIIATSTYGQKTLSGSWTLNDEKSELGDQFSLAPNTITLKQGKKSLEVEKHGSMQGEEYVVNEAPTN